jgi:hypothetical protein
MTSAKKPSTGRTGPPGLSKAVASTLVLAALEKLKDPKVRAQLIEHGHTVADTAKAWRAERSSGPGPSGDGTALTVSGVGEPSPRGVGDRFGQGKLDRRIRALRASMATLGGTGPELDAVLADMAAALDGITSALVVASRLPLVKRTQAHRRIDRELDALEQGLFDACMPGSA